MPSVKRKGHMLLITELFWSNLISVKWCSKKAVIEAPCLNCGKLAFTFLKCISLSSWKINSIYFELLTHATIPFNSVNCQLSTWTFPLERVCTYNVAQASGSHWPLENSFKLSHKKNQPCSFKSLPAMIAQATWCRMPFIITRYELLSPCTFTNITFTNN